jgi:arylsulfatase A-like enzyme
MKTLSLWIGLAASLAAAKPPNVVFILTDNQGAWTLGCYGNKDIQTPRIDLLAAQGVVFDNAFACNAVCSPNRATFLTGLIPSQHGVHCFLDPKYMMGPESYYTLAEFTTLPKVMKQAGYATGLVGKWHLGANLTPQDGFDYWLTKPDGSTREFYDVDLIHDGKVYREPRYTTEVFTEHAVRFIEQNKDRPFFLYLAYNGPYALGNLLLNPARNRWADFYADKPLSCFERDRMHPWLFNNKQFLNNPVSIRRVAAEVSGVDDGVGAVLDALQRLGLDEQTLVAYSSDNGWTGGLNGLFGMGDHTRPFAAFDSMTRIPMIFRHPGVIPPGRRLSMAVSDYDFMPSVLSHLGLADRMKAAGSKSPGRDFSPALRGQPIAWDDTTFYEMETTRSIRTPRWKYVDRLEGPDELYDLQADPYEKFNLLGQPSHDAVRLDLAARLVDFFSRTAEPKYDLFRGGGSKSQLLHRKPERPETAPSGKQSRKS